MRVLIVSVFFPPVNVVGATRMASLADHLADTGDYVSVISGALDNVPHGLGTALPPESIKQVTWSDRRIAQVLRGIEGSDSSSVNTNRLTVQNMPTARRIIGATRKVGSLVYHRLATPDWARGWIRPALRLAIATAEIWKPDVILASGPPFSAFIVAKKLSARTGIPWVADLRDPWAGRFYDAPGRVREAVDQFLERKVLQSATCVVTVSRPLAQDLEGRLKRRVAVVTNGYSRLRSDGSARAPLSNARLNILYVGNSLYGGAHNPGPLFAALHRLGVGRNDVRVHFLGTDSRTVLEMETAKDVINLLEFHPPVPYEKSLEMQERADALLLLVRNDEKAAGVFTGKFFEYVGARRPIILIGYEHGVAAQAIRERRLGYVCGGAAGVEEAVKKLLETPNRSVPLELGLRTGFSRSEQNATFRDILAASVKHSQSGPRW